MLVMLALSRLPGLSVYGVSIGGARRAATSARWRQPDHPGQHNVLGYLPFLLAVSLFTGAGGLRIGFAAGLKAMIIKTEGERING